MGRKKLTDEERKKIVALYVECQNMNEVARQFNVSWQTIKNIVSAEESTLKRLEEKKTENVLDMLEFLDSRKGKVMDFIDLCLKYVVDEEKLKKCRPTEIMTAMAIGIDKFMIVPNMNGEGKAGNLLEAISKQAKNLYDEDNVKEGVSHEHQNK